MALLIETRRPFHLGYHRGRASDPAGTIRTLNVGWIAIIWFRGSLVALLQRWQRAADEAVRQRATMWRDADTIGSKGE